MTWNDHDPIDDLVRRKLSSGNQPEADMWDTIESRFERRRRVLTWFNLAVVMLVLAMISGGIKWLSTRNDGTSSAIKSGLEKSGEPNALKNIGLDEHTELDASGNIGLEKRTDESMKPANGPVVRYDNSKTSAHDSKLNADGREQNRPESAINVRNTETTLPEFETTKSEQFFINPLIAERNPRDTVFAIRTRDAEIPAYEIQTAISVVSPIPHKSFAARHLKWQVGPQSQLLWVTKAISASPDFPEQYYERRTREEDGALATAYGLRLGAEFRRISLQTGLGYRRFAEKIAYSERSPSILIRSTAYVGPDSSVSYSYDTTNVNRANKNLSSYNGYHANTYLEIPLLIGYRFGSDAFSVQPLVGLTLNKPVRWKSRILDATMESIQQKPELSPTVTSWVIELSLSQRLGNRLRLNTFGVFHQNRTSVFAIGPDQRFRSVGGGVNVMFNF